MNKTDKKINKMIKDYRKIDMQTLLTINGALMWKTGLFTYPEWFQEIQSFLLARKIKNQYYRIQSEISRMEYLISINK